MYGLLRGEQFATQLHLCHYQGFGPSIERSSGVKNNNLNAVFIMTNLLIFKKFHSLIES